MSTPSPSPDKLRVWEKSPNRVPAFIEKWGFWPFMLLGTGQLIVAGGLTNLWWPAGFLFVPCIIYFIAGFTDYRQPHHAILRNFPLLGRARYVAESLRPELRQYFVESDHEENPYSREKRSIIYQRAKNVLDTLPFGTRRNVYGTGYEWINHSLEPKHPKPETARIMIGEGQCEKPYSSSLFNISAMSYGSLSKNAVLALNKGAKMGGFAHNTGEGGISPYHLEHGGDLIWQVGTGYFGCRSDDGGFDAEKFKATASQPSVRMIELKLSQGAKPAHGGILPAAKVTPEIAAIRGVPVGQDVNSPPAHRAFKGPTGLLEFITTMRELSGGKPVGFKLCVGNPAEFMAIVKAMLKTGLTPDFITVDGAEGGTGAAPLEFTNSVGAPLTEGLRLVHNTLVGAGLRDKLKLLSAGKISTGYHMMYQLCIGADGCNSARGMMFALGCIQALKCNSNHCPVGVATQDARLMRGLDVEDKANRVRNFHDKTVESLLELTGAAGLESPADLHPELLIRRTSQTEVQPLSNLYPTLPWGCLANGECPTRYKRWWDAADPDTFSPRSVDGIEGTLSGRSKPTSLPVA